jgi:hypothetical protein
MARKGYSVEFRRRALDLVGACKTLQLTSRPCCALGRRASRGRLGIAAYRYKDRETWRRQGCGLMHADC